MAESTTDATFRWLEEENHQFKTALFKLQQQVEQLQELIWGQGDRINTLENAITTSVALSARLNRVEEDARHHNELIQRTQDELKKLAETDEELQRQRTADQQRQLQVRAEMTQQQDTLGREQAAFLDRLQLVEEMGRRRQEESFTAEQELEALRAQDEKLNIAITGHHGQLSHHDQELANLQNEQISLHAEDEVIAGRVQRVQEQIRRLESAEELKELDDRLRQALSELGELHRVERLRLERMVVDVQVTQDQLRSGLEDLTGQTIQSSAKAQAAQQHLEQVRDQFWQLRAELAERLNAIAKVEERYRRRQITELEQQIKDLTAWEPRAPGV